MAPTPASSPHRLPLEGLGLPPPAVGRLTVYLDTLAEWSRRVNLTGARTPSQRVTRLVASVLPAAGLPEAGPLLDVGSGNGSPGLVIALLREDLDVTLLEPRTRRWAFLREAARRTGRANVRVLRVRHDAYTGPPARTVTLRALAIPLRELAPLVEAGGLVVVFGRPPGVDGPFEPLVQPDPREDLSVFRRLSPRAVPRET